MKPFILFAAAALIPVAAAASPMSSKAYVMKAGASDLFEMESSKLMSDSTNPKITGFAQMMIGDHSKSTADVTAAAQADKLPPMTPALTAKQQAMIDALKAKSGKARDALYAKDQVAAHTATLAFQKDYADSGTKPHLKAVAGQIVPVVEQHLKLANALLTPAAK
jgi:putative membrane protein